MPWAPELFSAPVLERFLEKRRAARTGVTFFDGLMTGEIDALVGSFAGEPEVLHPVRGRIKGAPAFARFVTDITAWMTERSVTVEEVAAIVAPPRGVEEFVLRLDGEAGSVELPLALAADLDDRDRMIELRIYFSSRPLTGARVVRQPLLQPDPDLRPPGVVGDHQRALAAGDVDAAVAAFAPDGLLREPAGGRTHRGTAALRAFYERCFANGGGMALEQCAVTDDGRACALEYNVVAWGRTELPPQAGIAVYVRGDDGRLAAVRIYDDVHPPLSRHLQEQPRTESRDAPCMSR